MTLQAPCELDPSPLQCCILGGSAAAWVGSGCEALWRILASDMTLFFGCLRQLGSLAATESILLSAKMDMRALPSSSQEPSRRAANACLLASEVFFQLRMGFGMERPAIGESFKLAGKLPASDHYCSPKSLPDPCTMHGVASG